MQNSNKGKRIYPSIFQPIKKSHAASRIRTCAGKSQIAFISNALTITTLHKLKVKRALHSPWTRMLHMYNLKHFVSVLQMVRALAPLFRLHQSNHTTLQGCTHVRIYLRNLTRPTPPHCTRSHLALEIPTQTLYFGGHELWLICSVYMWLRF